jgi:hypothetical protein
MSRGTAPVGAGHQAYAVMFGMVEQQASMIAYSATFLILGILFLAMIPFLFLMSRPNKSRHAAVH